VSFQNAAQTLEHLRIEEEARREKNWKRWGPYLSERQWGTVREDYSEGGDCWNYFPHDHARSRAYRWGEDGLFGITDRECRLCFALALWNGRDPILKERLFGLNGHEGNHGEDAKELYYYLDSTPTHSYMLGLYKYPQAEYPYARIVEENRRRGRGQPEFEVIDTGVFDDERYFDVFAEYAKASSDDILIQIRVANRGPEAAKLHVLPTVWFRNTWSWGCRHEGCWIKPSIRRVGPARLLSRHVSLDPMVFEVEPLEGQDPPEIYFTENETNVVRLLGMKDAEGCFRDAFHDLVIHGNRAAVKTKEYGTKAAAWYPLEVPAGAERTLRLRLRKEAEAGGKAFGEEFESTFAQRRAEADEFYAAVLPPKLSAEEQAVMRQAYAGLLWSKQFFHYIVADWLDGDPDQPTPPASRQNGRNHDWRHLYNRDVISMPDKWEYPWYAAWDLAFHMISFAEIDPYFAKQQLELFLREWYMHPNGQIPAYEFAFSDVNPPVHAWAAWRVYKMTGSQGKRDRLFLERAFHKLLMNFTWWVNRKDPRGKNIFAGGFLGLDNIGVFDRNQPLPTGGHLEQADGTAWMAFYCGTMLSIALELAVENPAYEDIASKFFEHFISIADAINHLGGNGLWSQKDGFYYDEIFLEHRSIPVKLRSMVGIIPLFAAEILDEEKIDKLPGFRKRMQWFLDNRKDLASIISYCEVATRRGTRIERLLAIPSRERLERMLRYILDENEFLSPCGVRSLSKVHHERPYVFHDADRKQDYQVEYVPGESTTGVFGGNSNWRGPIWFPLNYLLVEALERYHRFWGDDFVVEFPTGSGRKLNLKQVADHIAERLVSMFLPDPSGRRPVHGDDPRYREHPNWRHLVLFYEYFHGDSGLGLGASHQTGWTAVVTRLVRKVAKGRAAAERAEEKPAPARRAPRKRRQPAADHRGA
jgi:hypothetical protein